MRTTIAFDRIRLRVMSDKIGSNACKGVATILSGAAKQRRRLAVVREADWTGNALKEDCDDSEYDNFR